KIEHHSAVTARCNLSTFGHIYPLKSCARFAHHLKVPAACRINPVTSEPDQEPRASAAHHRQERALDNIERRRVYIVRTAFNPEHAWTRSDHQRWQDRL